MDTILSPGRRRVLGALGGLGAMALAGCGERLVPVRGGSGITQFGGLTMGTSYQVKLAGASLSASRLEALQADVHTALDAVNRGMSLHRADSELSRFNRHRSREPLALSRDLSATIQSANSSSAS